MNNLLTIAQIVAQIVSSVVVVFSAIFAIIQWRKNIEFNNVKYIKELLDELSHDKENQKVLYMFDYGEHWYDSKFHEDYDVQSNVDDVLSIFNYACYLLDNDLIGRDQFKLIKYDVDRCVRNEDVQLYLYNLYHWSSRANTSFPFTHLLNYGKKTDVIENDFYDSNSNHYVKILNF